MIPGNFNDLSIYVSGQSVFIDGQEMVLLLPNSMVYKSRAGSLNLITRLILLTLNYCKLLLYANCNKKGRLLHGRY